VTQTRHSDRATRRKRLLNFLCEELEDQMRRLEELVQQRIQLAQPHTVPPLEAAEEVQAISPEAPSPEVPTPAIELVEPESIALPEEEEPSGTYAIMTPTLADIYASQGLIKEAISVLEQILQQEPEREDVRRRLDDLERTLSESEIENKHDRTHPET